MSGVDNGGPAFPSHGMMGEVVQEGMTLRDYFAAHASEADIKCFIPSTIGGVADLMVRLGWTDKKARDLDPVSSYTDKQFRALRQWARYRHADAMLAARVQRGQP